MTAIDTSPTTAAPAPGTPLTGTTPTSSDHLRSPLSGTDSSGSRLSGTVLATPPTAELHLHVEGTLEPELVFALADRNDVDLPFASVDELRAAYSFGSLQEFLDLYYACTAVLQTAQDFRDLAWAYLERAHAQGLRHVEMFFDPQAHTSRDVDVDEVIDGLTQALGEARERFGITGGLILCFLRHLPVGDAAATLESVAHRASDLIGVGLDSSEVGFPPAAFARVFDRARALGLHVVAHAGEEGPPSYVTDALDLLHVERVDHGVRSLEDDALVARLVADRVPLTVCPLSNLRLAVVSDLAEHPLPRMLEAGLLVTVNSDDPAYFGGYVGDNYEALRDVLGLDDDMLALLATNSVEASFADAGRKAELTAEVQAWREARRAA